MSTISCPLKPAAFRSISPAPTDIRSRIRSADCALSDPRAEASDRMRSGMITVGSMSAGSTALIPSPVHRCSTTPGPSLSPHRPSAVSTSRRSRRSTCCSCSTVRAPYPTTSRANARRSRKPVRPCAGEPRPLRSLVSPSRMSHTPGLTKRSRVVADDSGPGGRHLAKLIVCASREPLRPPRRRPRCPAARASSSASARPVAVGKLHRHAGRRRARGPAAVRPPRPDSATTRS